MLTEHYEEARFQHVFQSFLKSKTTSFFQYPKILTLYHFTIQSGFAVQCKNYLFSRNVFFLWEFLVIFDRYLQENRIIVDVLLPEMVSRLYQEIRGISEDIAAKEIRTFELRLGLYDPDTGKLSLFHDS